MLRKIIFLFSFVFAINGAFANNTNNVYIINDIPVSYKSTDAKKAKEEAIKIAQRNALKELFRRGGINPDYTRFINDGIISEMVETIKIADEVITKQSYSSNLTIVFNKEFINFNLKKMGIGRNLIKDEVYLYIPLFEDESGKIKILADDTWYRAAYDNYFENNYENIFIIDNYSLSNAGLFSTNAIKNIDYNKFRALLTKYESNVVIIAVAKHIESEDLIEIRFKEVDAENIKERVLSFANKDNLDKTALIKEASVKTLLFLSSESQKRMAEARNDKKNIEKIKKSNYIDVYFAIPNFKEYVYVKSLINNFDFIQRYDLLMLTTKFASLRLYYKGEESELSALFSNKGFILQNKNNSYYLNYRGF